MTQIFNIFKKDARRHWPEIVISLALMGLSTRVLLRELNHPFGGLRTVAVGFIFSQIERGMVTLVPIAWLLLITRVIQGESLVGDRQFWVTRPYDWRKLLAAKALFIGAFISVPVLIQDAVILAATGFHPTAYLSGLLYIQWSLLGILVLIAALAAVTATVGQMFLALLAVVLYVAASAALVQLIPFANFSPGRSSSFEFLPFLVACAILFLQYSLRRTLTSRLLILALGVALWLTEAVTSYRRQINESYPLLAAGSPAPITIIPANVPSPNSFTSSPGRITVQFPISVDGLPEDSIVELDGFIVSLSNPSGHWESGWQSQNRLLFSDQKPLFLDLQIPQKNFEQMIAAPVSAHFLIAYTLYRNQNQRTFVVPGESFSLPELGNCMVGTDYQVRFGSGYWPGVSCLAPLRRPRFLLITSDGAANTCPENMRRYANIGTTARSVIQGSSGSVEDIFLPVTQIFLNLTNWETQSTNPGPCPGTPLTLSDPKVVSRNRIELQLDNMTITELSPGVGRIIPHP